MKRSFGLFFLTVVAMVAVVSIVCQAQSQSLLTRHVREVTLNGQAPSVGRLPATQSLRPNIILPLRDQAGLENFLHELYDPSSPFYRQYLTVKQFTDMYGPSQEEYDAVVNFAKTNGFEVVGGSRDGRSVQLKASVAAIESAFHITMGRYYDPIEKREFFAPDREPTVDLPFQLWHISGLDNYSIPRPAYVHKNLAKGPLVAGSCPSGTYCGSDMRAAYYGTGPLTGTGQNIGLLELAGTDLDDLTTYYTNVGQVEPYTPTLVSTGGYGTSCLAGNGCTDAEQTLDMTQAMGMAPGSTMLYMYVCGDAYGTGTFDETACFSAMVSASPLSLQLSSSWSWKPADPQTDDPYFQQMAAQGQSFFQAAGDSRAWASGGFVYPNEDAWVICVGGTDLTTNGAGGSWKSETGWPDSGGGISPDKIAIPSWQQYNGVINSANQGSTSYRNGPDVAAESNFDFYVCFNQSGCSGGWGGTSFAAPMWAGYLALANQQAVASGVPAPGFINPTIYPLGLGSGYSNDFHDITSGNNGFSAVAGYDLVTGWGSPNGPGLINALLGAAPSFNVSVSPVTVTVTKKHPGTATITGSVFGGFNSAITLSGSGVGTITFSPNPIPAPGTGTSTMTIKLGKGKTALGSYTVTITGMGAGQTDTTTMTVNVSRK
jgi:subtilase family serine protease